METEELENMPGSCMQNRAPGFWVRAGSLYRTVQYIQYNGNWDSSVCPTGQATHPVRELECEKRPSKAALRTEKKRRDGWIDGWGELLYCGDELGQMQMDKRTRTWEIKEDTTRETRY